jgi:hypothetical protein
VTATIAWVMAAAGGATVVGTVVTSGMIDVVS